MHRLRSCIPSRRLQNLRLLIGLLLLSFAFPAWGAKTWEVAIVRDGPSAQSDELQNQFTEELLALKGRYWKLYRLQSEEAA